MVAVNKCLQLLCVGILVLQSGDFSHCTRRFVIAGVIGGRRRWNETWKAPNLDGKTSTNVKRLLQRFLVTISFGILLA